jgi:hypothetical protein
MEAAPPCRQPIRAIEGSLGGDHPIARASNVRRMKLGRDVEARTGTIGVTRCSRARVVGTTRIQPSSPWLRSIRSRRRLRRSIQLESAAAAAAAARAVRPGQEQRKPARRTV